MLFIEDLHITFTFKICYAKKERIKMGISKGKNNDTIGILKNNLNGGIKCQQYGSYHLPEN